MVSDCTNGDIRLSGGLSSNEGIIELCIDGVWGGLCGDKFGPSNARVACRQLGLPEGSYIAVYLCSHHVTPGPGTGAVLLDDFQSLLPTLPLSLTCNGSESSLLQCVREDYRIPEGSLPPPCAVYEPATIRCQGIVTEMRYCPLKIHTLAKTMF